MPEAWLGFARKNSISGGRQYLAGDCFSKMKFTLPRPQPGWGRPLERVHSCEPDCNGEAASESRSAGRARNWRRKRASSLPTGDQPDVRGSTAGSVRVVTRSGFDVADDTKASENPRLSIAAERSRGPLKRIRRRSLSSSFARRTICRGWSLSLPATFGRDRGQQDQ
jgi:hypothetical protein